MIQDLGLIVQDLGSGAGGLVVEYFRFRVWGLAVPRVSDHVGHAIREGSANATPLTWAVDGAQGDAYVAGKNAACKTEKMMKEQLGWIWLQRGYKGQTILSPRYDPQKLAGKGCFCQHFSWPLPRTRTGKGGFRYGFHAG